MQEATARLAEAKMKANVEEKRIKKDLEAVDISKDDVSYISRELKISAKEATLKLRENGGDLRKTLETLVA